VGSRQRGLDGSASAVARGADETDSGTRVALAVGAVTGPGTDPRRRTKRVLLLATALLLVAAVGLVYAPVRHADFVTIDDPEYVTENPFVRDGLTVAGLRHALWGSRGALWMPLAFVSHMIDVELFGLSPRGPHLVNVALHAANAVLLLALLARATGAVLPSALVAVFFAVHPLRVESVAWIAERKDVLSAFFGLATLHAWLGYARRPGLARYLLVLLGFLLAVLAKPMLVTLPALMLLLDLWPLRRLEMPAADGRTATWRDLVLEKVPFLLLAAAGAALTFVTAREYGALVPLSARPIPSRILHAIVSTVWYVGKTLWPTRLGVEYPYPTWSAWQVGSAVLAFAVAGAACVRARRQAPWAAVGLAWFVIGLVPVSGLFQAGEQGMADRFTYLPGIGLLVAIVWTLDRAAAARGVRPAAAGFACAAAAALGIAANRQAAVWTDSLTLYHHTLAVTPDNWRIHAALGSFHLDAGRLPEAARHLEEAHRIAPTSPKAHFGLGLIASAYGRQDEAELHYRETLALDRTHVKAHNNLGVLLFERHDTDGGLHHLSEAAGLDDPDAADAAANLRLALLRLGLPDADEYVRELATWSAAVEADRTRAGGTTYGDGLTAQLLAPRAAAVRTCLADARDSTIPVHLYVAVAADGALIRVAAMPPTRAARCLRDELRAGHAAPPPFAPFHGKVALRVER
jgi:Flp pilus assembly protein TadD